MALTVLPYDQWTEEQKGLSLVMEKSTQNVGSSQKLVTAGPQPTQGGLKESSRKKAPSSRVFGCAPGHLLCFEREVA